MPKYLLAAWAIVHCGCQAASTSPELPSANQVIRDQLIVHSSVRLPARHRLLEELVGLRDDLSRKLSLPTSDEPIDVYLFKNEQDYQAFMAEQFPNFPGRRAIFVKNDTALRVFAFWGERVGEDLRHEVTHAYLHSVIPNLPLWMDEGLAEFFEVGRGRHGLHRAHIEALVSAQKAKSWNPDLRRLEELQNSEKMSELEYAESWLWTHFLLESTPDNLKMAQDQLARLRMSAEAGALADSLDKNLPDAANQLIEHLRLLAEAQSGKELTRATAK